MVLNHANVISDSFEQVLGNSSHQGVFYFSAVLI